MIDFNRLIIVHRGNYTNKYPENSIPAFKDCIKNKVPIELDIHIIKDCTLVVFHDDNLKRMCNSDKKIKDFNYKELLEYKLLDSEYFIPTLEEVLDLVNGKVLLDIEIKNDVLNKNIERHVLNLLSSYSGDFILKSFNPRIVRNLKKLRKKYNMDFKVGLLLVDNFWAFLFYIYSNPDFISFNYKNLSKRFFRFLSKLKPTLLYTFKNKDALESVKNFEGGFIIENYDSIFNEK